MTSHIAPLAKCAFTSSTNTSKSTASKLCILHFAVQLLYTFETPHGHHLNPAASTVFAPAVIFLSILTRSLITRPPTKHAIHQHRHAIQHYSLGFLKVWAPSCKQYDKMFTLGGETSKYANRVLGSKTCWKHKVWLSLRWHVLRQNGVQIQARV